MDWHLRGECKRDSASLPKAGRVASRRGCCWRRSRSGDAAGRSGDATGRNGDATGRSIQLASSASPRRRTDLPNIDKGRTRRMALHNRHRLQFVGSNKETGAQCRYTVSVPCTPPLRCTSERGPKAERLESLHSPPGAVPSPSIPSEFYDRRCSLQNTIEWQKF